MSARSLLSFVFACSRRVRSVGRVRREYFSRMSKKYQLSHRESNSSSSAGIKMEPPRHAHDQIEIRIFSKQQRKPGVDELTIVQQKPCGLCDRVRAMRERSKNLTKRTESSDVEVLASNGQKFYCHSFVLAIWAPHLLVQRPPFEIRVDDFTGDVVGASLLLMYGGSVEQMPVQLLTEIMKLANIYKISDLQKACVQAAATAPLAANNVSHIWYYANVHNVSQLRDRAVAYLMKNVEAVSEEEAWDEMMGNWEAMSDLFIHVARSSKPKQVETPERDHQMDEMWEKSGGLRKSYANADMIVTTKDDVTLYVHLPLIALSSPKFANMLYTEGGKAGRVTMGDFDGDVVEEFLRGLYRQDPSKRFDKTVDHVYVLACDNEADLVADACERQIASQHLYSIESAIEQLKEAEEHRMTVAKDLCAHYLYQQADKLAQTEAWTKFAKENAGLIADMIVNWEEYRGM